MDLTKAFLASGLLSVFALTACDNQEKKEADKAAVEAPVPVPATPDAPKATGNETPAPEAHFDAPKTDMPKIEAPAAPAMETPNHESTVKPDHENKTSEDKTSHEGSVAPTANTVETPVESMPENK